MNGSNIKKIQTYPMPPNAPVPVSTLRPKTLDGYVGQETIKGSLTVALAAAKKRKCTLGHILLCGPPGLGKTTLARIIANAMDAPLRTMSGAAIEKSGDLVGVLASIPENTFVFMDEIHRLPKNTMEMLYSAMEDGRVDITIGQGEQTKAVNLTLPSFTLIGATTRAGMLTQPLRDRFQHIYQMEWYTESELAKVITHTASILGITMDNGAVCYAASCSRGTPRIANRLVRIASDHTVAAGKTVCTEKDCREAFMKDGVYDGGLQVTEIKILQLLHKEFADKPVGLCTICAALGEEKDVVESMYEPFLLRGGYIIKTPRGRQVTEKGIGYQYKVNYPSLNA